MTIERRGDQPGREELIERAREILVRFQKENQRGGRDGRGEGTFSFMSANMGEGQVLQPDEEVVLIGLIQAAASSDNGFPPEELVRKAEEALVKNHWPLVVSCAQPFKGGMLPWEDLLQEGLLALWRAIFSFREGEGKFSTYAHECVRGGIMRAVGNTGRGGIRVPVYTEGKRREIKREISEGEARGEEGVEEEILRRWGVSPEEWQRMNPKVVSFEEIGNKERGDGRNLPLFERIGGRERSSEEKVLSWGEKELRRILSELLPWEEAIALWLHEIKGLTFREAAAEMGVSYETVRNYYKRAIEILRGEKKEQLLHELDSP